MSTLIIDNYDSFTFNLVHYVEALGEKCVVLRNNEVNLSEILNFDRLILSPGPGLPAESGLLMEIVEKFHDKLPILGVCLGFQALGEYFGGILYNQEFVKHGMQERIKLIGQSEIFRGLPTIFDVGLYHSWALSEPLPQTLLISAKSENNVVMAFQHKIFPIFGVQFHPESILTPFGKKIVANFLNVGSSRK